MDDGKRKGVCACGISYSNHPTCVSCGVLAHTNKKFCKLADSDVLVGYIPIGHTCWSCKQDQKIKKRRDKKYLHHLEVQRRATKAFRLRNLEKMREKGKEIARRDKTKRLAARKMKLANSPQALHKKRTDHRAWIAKHSGYHKEQYQKHREKRVLAQRERRRLMKLDQEHETNPSVQ